MQSHTIDSVALSFLDELKGPSAQLLAKISFQRICIFGNHEQHGTQMEDIARLLCEDNYPATLIRKIPDQEALSLPDYEKETTILQKSDIVVVIDNSDGGVVRECAYLMAHPELMEKTIIMVNRSVPTEKIYGPYSHYMPFLTKVIYTEDTLITMAVMVAKQTSHRLALKELKENDGNSNK